MNYQKLHETFLHQEERNEHAENAVLLAKHFGTESELAEAKRRLAERNRRGWATFEDSGFQARISTQYYRGFVALAKAQK